MSTPAEQLSYDTIPEFTQGIRYFGPETSELDKHGQYAVIGDGQSAITDIDEAAVYQTQIAADALRYLNTVLAVSPDEPQERLSRAIVQYQLGKQKKAGQRPAFFIALNSDQ